MPIPANARVERRPVLPGTWIPGRAVSGGRPSGHRGGRPGRTSRPARLNGIASPMMSRPGGGRSGAGLPRMPPRTAAGWSFDAPAVPWAAEQQDNASDAGDAEDRSEERPRRAPVRSGAAATSNTNSDDNGDDASAADTEEDNSLLRRSTPADAASTGSGAITQEQLVELASQKAKTTPRQVDIRASDRDNLVGLRQPMPLPDAWIKMNRLSPERVRKTEAKLRRVIKDVNQLANYLSPASLLERIASGDLLAPMKLLGDTVKQALHLVTDITQDVLLVGDVLNGTSDALSHVVDVATAATTIQPADRPANASTQQHSEQGENTTTTTSTMTSCTPTPPETIALIAGSVHTSRPRTSCACGRLDAARIHCVRAAGALARCVLTRA
ncbi:hypothetical protein SYNPS1DRAFT_29900 [Syncephalis pseudoplumigaleata]|uniref:Uncharacterized protein n=1 Tax=Syncephalis pseudoplumigaleata TaxID=1712513 RepID=A0A4V1J1A0_9FUNG|nr:hypothetical protein SYNPS1DRAFT_29900 [Syncephalis pseudoplumigaleata]|eukprot:RKP24329.1 hypothetical protein SYNPS1DRAFT_29900 [Syncephalis pseudoplumigaleata]